MSTIDLTPAAQRLGDLLAGVPEDLLAGPTPCPDYTLGDLVDHIGGLASAFGAAAAKDIGEATGQAPAGDASRLAGDWKTWIARDLIALADAWRDPAAWTGMTQVGGVDLPAEACGLFALDELVIHGWDVARASGQGYDIEAAALEPLVGLLAPLAEPGREASRTGLFGPVVTVPAGAPLLERVLGLSGRDPAWTPLGAAAHP
jgi:uncharacterized protein (TIGR03086 family)